MAIKGIEKMIYAAIRKEVYMLNKSNTTLPPSSSFLITENEQEKKDVVEKKLNEEEKEVVFILTEESKNDLIGCKINCASGSGIIHDIISSIEKSKIVVEIKYFSSTTTIDSIANTIENNNSDKNNNEKSLLVTPSKTFLKLVDLKTPRAHNNLDLKKNSTENNNVFDSTTYIMHQNFESKFLNNELLIKLISFIIKQLAEKLDAVKFVAGSTLYRLISHQFLTHGSYRLIPNLQYDIQYLELPDRNILTNAFLSTSFSNKSTNNTTNNTSINDDNNDKKSEDDNNENENDEKKFDNGGINWSNPTKVYSFVADILVSNVYYFEVLSGLVISVGDVTESIAKNSTEALIAFYQYNKSISNFDLIITISYSLIQLLQNNSKNDRIIVPLLKTFDVLLRNNLLKSKNDGAIVEASFYDLLYTGLLVELKGCCVILKLHQIFDLLLLLLTSSSSGSSSSNNNDSGEEKEVEVQNKVRLNALKTLIHSLLHKYPTIRKCKFI
jgi:hypothetical protein